MLVRPSYVLGGRAMDVVYDDEELETYIEEAVRVSPGNPILVDDFLEDAVELDVDAVADGRSVLIGGIMEHIETAGVHSGDSACMIPPGSLDEDTLRRVREVTEDIAKALKTKGLMNVQLAVTGVGEDEEARCTSWRRTPLVAYRSVRLEGHGRPDRQDRREGDGRRDPREPRGRRADPRTHLDQRGRPALTACRDRTRVSAEMKSTGEVMGTASEFGTAYWKAQQAAGNAVSEGTAVVDLDVDGFEDHFDVEAFDDVPQAIREGEVDFVVSRDRDSLEMAVEEDPLPRRWPAPRPTSKRSIRSTVNSRWPR